jgi:hypothetical protein
MPPAQGIFGNVHAPACSLFSFCERISVLWRRTRGEATAPARHFYRRLALLRVALAVVHSQKIDTQVLLL